MYALLLTVLAALSIVQSRDVPALQDICSRGTWAFCPQSAAANRPARPAERLPAADVPPSNSAAAASPDRPPSPPSSVGEYCGKYQPHFMFFCSDEEAKDKKATDFCSDYMSHCILKEKGDSDSQPQPVTQPPVFVPCATYRPQYTRSCTQVVTNPSVAQFCQNYQTYCMKGPTTVPPTTPIPASQLAMAQIKDKCNEYRNAAKLYCTGPVTKIEAASAKEYCDLYRRYCVATGFAPLS